MSNAELEIVNDYGTFMVTDKNPTLVYVGSGTVTCTGWGNAVNVTLPAGRSCIVVAFRGGPFRETLASTSSSPQVEGPSGTVVTWYMFARPVSGTNAGLEIYDDSGNLTFSSEGQWGHVVSVVNPTQASYNLGSSSTNTGPIGVKTLYDSGTFPTGKVYAMIDRYRSDRSYMPSAPTSTVYHYSATYTCTNKLLIQERQDFSAPSDTNDNLWRASGAVMLIDVTGFGGGIVTHNVVITDIAAVSQAAGSVQKTSTATVTNGSGTFTYLWAWVGGTPAGLSIISGSTSATVTIQSTGDGQTRTGTLRCTVTDTGNGNVTAYDDGSVSVQHVASLTNHTVYAADISEPAPEGVSSHDTTAVVSNGVGPFTYSWAWVGGTPAGLAIVSGQSSATVGIHSSGWGQTRTGTLRVTVVDTGNGNYSTYDDVAVSVTHADTVQFSAQSFTEITSLMGISFSENGPLYKIDGSTYIWIGNWRDPNSFSSDYEIRATNITGVLGSFTSAGGNTPAGDWTPMGWGNGGIGGRDFFTYPGSSANFTIEIRSRTGDGTILASGWVWLEALPEASVAVSDINSSVPEGTSYPTSTATVSGGGGPFTYYWEWIGGTPTGMSIYSGQDTATVTIQSNGYGATRTGTLRCTITDTGDGSRTVYDDASVSVAHAHTMVLASKVYSDSSFRVGVSLDAGGAFSKIVGGSMYADGYWRYPQSWQPEYECRAEVLSGDLASYTTTNGAVPAGDWVIMGGADAQGSREFITTTSSGFNLQFRARYGDGTILHSVPMSLTNIVAATVQASSIYDTGNGNIDYAYATSTATVSDGVGPFTYAWSWVGTHTGLEIYGSAFGSSVSIRSYAQNSNTIGTLRCTVTDTGNGNVTTYDDTSVEFVHGNWNLRYVKLTNQTIVATGAWASFRLAGGGKLRLLTDTTNTEIAPFDEWRDDETTAYSSQARATSSPANLTSATGQRSSVSNTEWIGLSGPPGENYRDWTVQAGKSATFTVQIADGYDSNIVLTQATITLTCNAPTHIVSAPNIFDHDNTNNVWAFASSTATVSGGVGPFTYSWSWIGTHTGLGINGSVTGSTVTVESYGSNVENTGTLRCTVTDTGNGNITAYDEISVSMQHGTPQ